MVTISLACSICGEHVADAASVSLPKFEGRDADAAFINVSADIFEISSNGMMNQPGTPPDRFNPRSLSQANGFRDMIAAGLQAMGLCIRFSMWKTLSHRVRHMFASLIRWDSIG